MDSIRLPFSIPFGTVLIVFGVILLLNPLYIGMLDLDEPNWYRYEASQVTFEDDHVNSSIEVMSFDSEVACLNRDFRVCRLE